MIAKKKPKIDRAKFVQSWALKPVLYDAMITAGYEPAQARKGRAALSKPLLAIVDDAEDAEFTLEEYERIGAMIESPEQAERIIKGFLLTGIMRRNGKGTEAAKLLSQLRSVNLLTPESRQGIFVIQAPSREMLESFDDMSEEN